MVKSKIRKQQKKLKSQTKKKIKRSQIKMLKKQFGGQVTQEDINLWRGFNGIVNSYINYKIFLKDEWKTDSCKFFVDGFTPFKEFDFRNSEYADILKQLSDERKKRQLNFISNDLQPNLLTDHVLMEKCKDEMDSSIKCKVTPDSSTDKLRCHLETNYNIFNENIDIKIPNTEEEFKLIKIIYHKKNESQVGGNIEKYITSLYSLRLLNDTDTKTFFKEKIDDGRSFNPDNYAKRKISKYLEYGSFFFYLNKSKNKLVINFPKYDDPYLYYLSAYHDDTELTTSEILDGIRVHNGYNDLVLKHIDELDKIISSILYQNSNINYILFTGHSIGSSIIQLTLFYLLAIKKNKILNLKLKNIKLFTTGAPRVGNYAWFKWWNQQGFKDQIFNVYHINDTYSKTPGVKNTPPYTSNDKDDFYPINPILLDYKSKTKSYKIVNNKTKRATFFYSHFDYLNFKNTEEYKTISVMNHNLLEYETMFKKINLSELTQPVI
jgi:hypothetical protein